MHINYRLNKMIAKLKNLKKSTMFMSLKLNLLAFKALIYAKLKEKKCKEKCLHKM